MSDDDPWDETPRCPYCCEQLGYLQEVVEIQIGELSIGRKSGLHCFSAMEAFPDLDPAKYLHMHCLLTMMDFADAHDSEVTRCNICERNLTREAEVYRIRIGKLVDTGDDPFWEFVPKADDRVTVYLCSSCMLEGLGEGDQDAGCVMLGMA